MFMKIVRLMIISGIIAIAIGAYCAMVVTDTTVTIEVHTK